MASTINGTSTGNGGLVSTGDDSGVLNIQTNETTAISIDASQSVDFTNNIDAPNTFGMKNRLINGSFLINQRNGTSAVTTSALQAATYFSDRWYYYVDVASKLSFTQSTDAPAGFTSSNLITVLATDVVGPEQLVRQKIEGYNIADLGWGASGAKSCTLSFWVKSSVTGTFGGSLQDTPGTYSYPFSYTINATNTWEQKTVLVTGPTSGTFGTTNGAGMVVSFELGLGYQAAAANTWTATNATTATGTANFLANSGATMRLTGVQFEKGTQATSFDFRSIGTEFDLCRRYCEVYSGTAEQAIPQYLGNVDVSNRPEIFLTYYPKRAAPTVTVASGTAFDWLSSANTVVQTSAYNGTSIGSGINGAILFFSTASGVTAGTLSGTGCISFRTTNSITVSAEL